MTQSTTPTTGETKFREDLKTYFPDLYKFWALFSFDPHMQQVLEGLITAQEENMYGELRITYQKGKVNYVNLTKQLTAHTRLREHYKD